MTAQTSQRHWRGRAIGVAGLTALFLTIVPIWAGPANADVVQVFFEPHTGVAGTAIGFQIGGCEQINGSIDIVIEINTDTDDEFEGTFPDYAVYELDPNGTYGFVAPPEIDFLTDDPSAGPTYDVVVTCVATGENDDDPQFVELDAGDFTYVRATTTSTTATSSTTTTVPGSTTSTAPTTTSTTPSSSTSSTAPDASSTTSSTAPGATTSTTAGSTTSSSAPGGSTTSTAPAASSTSSTAAPAATTSTLAGATSTSALGSGGAATSSSSSSTTATTEAPAATASDPTPTPGQVITVSAPGFAPGSPVQVDLLSTPVRLATLTADAQGVASGSVTIPLRTEAGSHEIRLTGVASDGSAVVRSVPITVERALPQTGSDSSWSMLRIGLLLIGFGLLIIGRAQMLATETSS